nr:hypothetical protein B0A51_08097 [Rachicladosporium sp. CCFEE 5018]
MIDAHFISAKDSFRQRCFWLPLGKIDTLEKIHRQHGADEADRAWKHRRKTAKDQNQQAESSSLAGKVKAVSEAVTPFEVNADSCRATNSTSQRRLRSSKSPSAEDVVEIPRKTFDGKLEPSKPGVHAGKVVTQRRLPIDEAPKLGTHVLFLFVGPDRVPLTLHTNILPPSTITALQQHYHNGFTQLDAYTIESFELYRVWLYTGKLYTRVPEYEGVGAVEVVLADREWGRLANAYVLGVDLDDERFANAMVDAMIEKVDGSDRYPTSLATDLWLSLDQGDKLCNLIVDFHIWKGLGTGIKKPHEDAAGPPTFLSQVKRGLKAAGKLIYDPEIPEPWKENPLQSAVNRGIRSVRKKRREPY